MLTKCDECGKKIVKRRGEVEKYEHHFCDNKCYHMWKKTHYISKKGQKSDYSARDKIKLFAQLRLNAQSRD